MCSHKTKTQAHGQQNKITSHVQNRTRTRNKLHVHTRHDNMKAHSQWNTQAACHTAQDITWMHAADKNKSCVQCHKTHVDRRVSGQANSRSHAHTTRQNTERESPNPDTKTETQDMSAGIWTPRSNTKQGTQTREHAAWAHSKPHAHVKTGHDGSVRALSQNPWMTPDRSDRTLTLTPSKGTRKTKNKTGTWQHKNMTNMTTQDRHTTDKTRKKI